MSRPSRTFLTTPTTSTTRVFPESRGRAAAFDACRFGIDTLKRNVPIWKKEFFGDGAVWAEGEIPSA